MRARRVRVLRGTSAAAIAVLLAATAHTLSGGDAPPAWLVCAVAVLTAPLCIALVGRRRRLGGLAAAVGIAQLALHAAFSVVGGAAGVGTMPAPGGHHHALMLGASGTSLAGASAPLAGTAIMASGHALAALVTFAVLAWGERLLAAIARGIRRLLRSTSANRLPRPVPTPIGLRPRRGGTAHFLLCVTRRGPPAHPALAPAV